MSEFTKGPWRIAGKGTIRAGDWWIGRVNWCNRDANARLIAAAPDMYEALTSVLADIDGGTVTQGTVNEIKFAISKADGK